VSALLHQLHEDLCNDLERIAARFKSRPKITLLIRSPELPDGDVLLSDDDLALAIKAILRMQEKVQPGHERHFPAEGTPI